MSLDARIDAITKTVQDDDTRWRVDMARVALTPHPLPGPTGESNVLYLEPKGHILIICEDEAYIRHYRDAIIAALVAGNHVTACPGLPDMADGNLALKFVTSDAAKALIISGEIEGMVYCGSEERAGEVQQSLSTREGALIIPVCLSDAETPLDPHIIYDLVTEKTVTINTAAIGGNAELLGLGG